MATSTFAARYLSEHASPEGPAQLQQPPPSPPPGYNERLDDGIGDLLPSPRSDVSELMLREEPSSIAPAADVLEDEASASIIAELSIWAERRKRAHHARLKLAEYKLVHTIRHSITT